MKVEYAQVTFITPVNEFGDPEKTMGGIARYEDNKLQYVICGYCGQILSPLDVTIQRKFVDWLPISDEIIGE